MDYFGYETGSCGTEIPLHMTPDLPPEDIVKVRDRRLDRLFEIAYGIEGSLGRTHSNVNRMEFGIKDLLRCFLHIRN